MRDGLDASLCNTLRQETLRLKSSADAMFTRIDFLCNNVALKIVVKNRPV